jgi:hypothetical protein
MMIAALNTSQYRNILKMAEEWISLKLAASQATLTAILQITSQKENKQARFFTHYRKYSEQLVTALKQWGEGLSFTSCKYEGGQLHLNCSEQVEPLDISYMEQKKLLEKAYPTILKAPTEMETKHKELCNQIEKIMVSEAPVLLPEHSYQ